MSTPLPLVLRQLHAILHLALVEMRTAARSGRIDQVLDLADCFEMVASCLNDPDNAALERIRGAIHWYQTKHAAVAFHYLSVLDMDVRQFDAAFGPVDWGQIESQPTASA